MARGTANCLPAAAANITNNSVMCCPERKDGALIKEAFPEKGKSTAFWKCNSYPDCRAIV
jgi:ssDNA-binding Zn-finger/Zn-ribbon topoisomerase 1